MQFENIQLGNLVELNSGGPRMTVTKIETETDEGPMVWCSWIGGDGMGHEHCFPPACIKPINLT